MRSVIILIDLLLAIMQIQIAYKLFTATKIKKIWIIYLISTMFLIVSGNIFLKNNLEMAFYFAGTVADVSFICLSHEKILNKFKQFGIVFGLSLGIELSIYFLVLLIKRIADIEFNYFEEQFICPALTILVFIALYLIKSKIKITEQTFFKHIKYIILSLAICTIGMLIGVFFILYYRQFPYSYIFLIIFAMVSCACVEGLIVLSLYLRNIYDRQMLYVAQIKEMAKAEEKYYRDLLNREKSTRKFRHDIKSHLLVIHDMVKKGNNKNLLNYLDNLGNNMIFSESRFATGNSRIDVLTNYYISEIEKDTNISLKGLVSDEMDINDTALCIIYGNLLQNAVEAINMLPKNVDEKKLEIEFEEGRFFFRFKISNSLGIDIPIDFNTVKDDKANHGFGIINVREAVKGLDGEMIFNQTNKRFEVVVTLPFGKVG